MTNIKTSIIVYLSIGLLLQSCRFFSGYLYADSNNQQKINLLGYCKYITRFETQRPFHLKTARHLFYQEGWDLIGPDPLAIKRDPVFTFFSSKKVPRKLTFDIANSIYLPNKSVLHLSVFLNGKWLKDFFINKIKRIEVELSKKHILIGLNKLRFFVHNPDPTDGNVESQYPGIWFRVKSTCFAESPDLGNDFVRLNGIKTDRFYQPVNSSFTIALDSMLTKGIDLSCSPLNTVRDRIRLKIEMKRAGMAQKLIVFDGWVNKPNDIRFSYPASDGKFNLRFSLFSDNKNTFIVWKRFNFIQREISKIEEDLQYSQKDLKNIFIIVFDALRYDLLNLKRNRQQVMPILNDFSHHAYNFSNFYANAPYTGASVATMFTSLLPEVHTVRRIGNIIPNNIKTLPSLLKADGFKTFAYTGNPVLFMHRLLKDFDVKKEIYDFGNQKTSLNRVDLVVKKIENLKENQKHLFYIHLLPPHKPYLPPSKFGMKLFLGKEIKNRGFDEYPPEFKEYQFGTYLNNAHYGDFLLGKLLRSIKKKGLYEKSLIIVTADHGEGFGEHNEMMGHGKNVYNESLHIPFLLKFPNQSIRKEIKSPHSLLDLLPTIISFLDLKRDSVWQGSPLPVRSNVIQKPIYARAVGSTLKSMLLTGTYKYMFHSGIDKLYNTKNDMREQKNLYNPQDIDCLLMKQSLFLFYLDNKLVNKKLGYKKKTIKIKPWNSHLKTLGYL